MIYIAIVVLLFILLLLLLSLIFYQEPDINWHELDRIAIEQMREANYSEDEINDILMGS